MFFKRLAAVQLRHYLCLTGLIVIPGMVFCLLTPQPAAAEDLLRDGDRVVLLGGTFVERMQSTGFLETMLTAANPGKSLAFRNLGWSGDNVRGHSRAVFGKPDEGFNRLLKDFKQTNPTVAVVCYGANEANAGAGKLPQFKQDYNRLLDALTEAAPGVRLILVAPPHRENAGEPFPSQEDYNKTLDLFAAAIRDIAKERDVTFVDFRHPIQEQHTGSSSAGLDRLTSNGVHFTRYGYWRAAPAFAAKFGVKPAGWDVTIDAKKVDHQAKGATVSSLALKDGVSFTTVDATLPHHAPPEHSPRGAEMKLQQARLCVKGLPEGKYQLLVDGKPVVVATAAHWSDGVHFARSYSQQQLNELSAAVEEKNALFFHRHRPQNETYLFLFRKHEQGNNAVEIPQFDPLIEKVEARIAKLAQPKARQFTLQRVAE